MAMAAICDPPHPVAVLVPTMSLGTNPQFQTILKKFTLIHEWPHNLKLQIYDQDMHAHSHYGAGIVTLPRASSGWSLWVLGDMALSLLKTPGPPAANSKCTRRQLLDESAWVGATTRKLRRVDAPVRKGSSILPVSRV